jgi:hypothetical protein
MALASPDRPDEFLLAQQWTDELGIAALLHQAMEEAGLSGM